MGREIAEYGEVLTFAGYPEFEAAADRAATVSVSRFRHT